MGETEGRLNPNPRGSLSPSRSLGPFNEDLEDDSVVMMVQPDVVRQRIDLAGQRQDEHDEREAARALNGGRLRTSSPTMPGRGCGEQAPRMPRIPRLVPGGSGPAGVRAMAHQVGNLLGGPAAAAHSNGGGTPPPSKKRKKKSGTKLPTSQVFPPEQWPEGFTSQQIDAMTRDQFQTQLQIQNTMKKLDVKKESVPGKKY